VKLSFGFLPSVSSDGSAFLVAWLLDQGNYSTELRVALISNEGVVRNAETIATFRRNETLPLTAPSLVWNGTNYLVVWSDAASIRARHVDRQGNPAAETITIARSQGVEVTAPDVAWNGSMYLVTFSYRNEWATPTSPPGTTLYATRMSVDGTQIDSPYPLIISTALSGDEDSSVAAAGSTFLVLWENQSLYSATVDAATGAVGPHQTMARRLWEQSRADGVFDGANFGFMWQETTTRSPDEPLVMFGRVTPDGRHLDGRGTQIGRGFPGPIAVTDVYLVTWQPWFDRRYGVRISKDGRILDEEPLALPSSDGILGSNGESFLYVGTESIPSEDGSYTRTALRVSTIGSSGEVSSTREIIPPAQFDLVPIDVAWNGSRYLLLYQRLLGRDDCHRCFPAREIWMVMLDGDGRPLLEPRLVARTVSGFVAGGDERFIVVAGGLEENHYRIIGNDGGTVVERPLPVEPVDAAWDGTFFSIAGYSVRWESGRTAYGASVERIDRDGLPVNEARFTPIEPPFDWRLIPAGGTLALLRSGVEPLGGAHDAGIRRYRFSWLEQRRRAVAR
jgi:hypothetical protein